MINSDSYDSIQSVDDTIVPTSSTSYWIYTMSSKMWDQYTRATDSSEDDSMYISNMKNYDITEGDIIFYYVKNYSKSGFMGIARTNSEQIPNSDNKIKIFKDQHLNKKIIKIDYLTTFNTPVNIRDIMEDVTDDVSGHRNRDSFISKYVKGTDIFVKLECHGDRLLKKLYQLTGPDSDQSSEEDDTVIAQNNSTEDTPPEEPNTSNRIPIMVTPCREFNLPKLSNKQAEYIVTHIKKCNMCDITDNNKNSLNIGYLLNSTDWSNIEVITIKNTNNIHYEIPLEYYFTQTEYDIPNSEKYTNFIRIAIIDNGDDIYQGCLLVTCKVD